MKKRKLIIEKIQQVFVAPRLSKQFKDLGAGTYPLAAGFEKDPDSVPKIKSKKVALKTLKQERKRIEESREERRRFKLAMKQKSKKGTLDSDQITTMKKKNEGDEILGDEQDDTLIADNHGNYHLIVSRKLDLLQKLA